MRINKVITQEKNALIFYQILSTHSLRQCMEISLENLYVDTYLFSPNKGVPPPLGLDCQTDHQGLIIKLTLSNKN